MTTNRHVHHRGDGIAVICTRRRCGRSQRRDLAWRALLVTAPVAVLATSIALGPRRFGISLALLAIAGYLWGKHALGGSDARTGLGARARVRDGATSPRTGSAA
jgi:hypothetical protein